MTTVSDLATSLSGISLSLRSSTFTLVSSDGQRFDVDSAKLAFHSKVYADMFDTVGESAEADRTCDLAEDGATVKAFLEALEGVAPQSEQAWVGVWRMMDKYECKALRAPSLLAGWSRLGRLDTAWAYAAGCHLRDFDLAWAALHKCQRISMFASMGPAYNSLSSPLKTLFWDYRREKVDAARPTSAGINFGKTRNQLVAYLSD